MLRLGAWTYACLACAACGGAIAAEPQEAGTPIDASAPPVADVVTEPVMDAASEEAPFCDIEPDSACDVVSECIWTALSEEVGLVWTFPRESDMLDFIRVIAVNYGWCTANDTCQYDPLGPEPPDASPANYVNAQNEFVGPDGQDYIITWLQKTNSWAVVRRKLDPSAYQAIAQYNECTGQGLHADQ